MRAVIQRVGSCRVDVDGTRVGEIAAGLLIYLGVAATDTDQDLEYLVEKVAHLRIFEDADGKMNRSATDVGADFLVVSQFTLYADLKKGRRPSYDRAAPPERARELYERFVERLRHVSGARVETGRFQAKMEVRYTNLGPVTILADSEKSF